MPGATRPRVGLALAGGGPLGAIHEIGALCAT
jgi:NTE family protein